MLTLWTNWYFKWYCWRIKSSFSLCHIWALQYRISTWSYDALRIVSDSGDWLICIRFLRFRTFRWRVYNFRMEWIQRYWSCNKLPEKNRKSFKHCSLGKKVIIIIFLINITPILINVVVVYSNLKKYIYILFYIYISFSSSFWHKYE